MNGYLASLSGFVFVIFLSDDVAEYITMHY